MTHNREELLIQFEPIIYKHMHRLGLWRLFESSRDDLMQEGRLAILHAADTWDSERGVKLSTYTYVVVRNALLRAQKKLGLFNNYYNSVPYEDNLKSTPSDSEDEVMYDELREYIDIHKHKIILGAYFIDGYTQEEVSKKLDISQQWVSQVINRFRNEMTQVWKT